MKLPRTLLLIACHAFLATGPAWGAPIAELIYVETNLGNGLWQYDYTIVNAGDPVEDVGFDLFDAFLNFDTSATLTVVSLPNDWSAIDGEGFVDVFSTSAGIPPGGADIPPGVALQGLVLQFDRPVGDLPFETLFTNPQDPSEPWVVAGTTMSSAPIPEPSSNLTFAAGLLLVTWTISRESRRRLNS